MGRSRDGAIRVGVISDTHGLLRPEALRVLRGSDVVVHAGDVGDATVLDGLRGLAPTFVVRGNNDTGAWAAKLPRTARLRVGIIELFVLHELSRLDLDPAATDIGIVVSGHSHRPSVARRDGVVYVNPGSAGPRRFALPISVALLRITGPHIRTRIVELEC